MGFINNNYAYSYNKVFSNNAIQYMVGELNDVVNAVKDW